MKIRLSNGLVIIRGEKPEKKPAPVIDIADPKPAAKEPKLKLVEPTDEPPAPKRRRRRSKDSAD